MGSTVPLTTVVVPVYYTYRASVSSTCPDAFGTNQGGQEAMAENLTQQAMNAQGI